MAAGDGLRALQVQHERLRTRLEAIARHEQALEAQRTSLAAIGSAAAHNQIEGIDAQLTKIRATAAAVRSQSEPLLDRIHERLRVVLPEVARRLTMDVPELIRTIQRFEAEQGRRLDAKEIIEALRDRVRKHPFADLEGMVSTQSLEENIIAVEDMRAQIHEIAPDAVLSVQRGGAFLAEVLAHGDPNFPQSIPVEKAIVQENGNEVERRVPNIEAAIRAGLENGQRTFVIVDFYMGGHFAEELENMAIRLSGLPNADGLKIHTMWLRETHGYDVLAGGAVEPGEPLPRITREHLNEGVTFVAGRGTRELVGLALADTRAFFRAVSSESPAVTLPVIKGNADNLPVLQVWHYPVGIVLGDDMDTVFDPDSTRPIKLFDRDGNVTHVIKPGMRIPGAETGIFRNTRDIVLHLMTGGKLPPDSEQTR